MIRTGLMPHQIHNFAHNNEWLVRNLLFVGRVDDALDLSRNLISLPRHPQHNSMKKGGSYKFGRQRLIQTLTQYGLWDELLKESGGSFWTPSEDAAAQEEWLAWLAVAQFQAKTGKPAEGARILRSLKRRQLALQEKLLDLAEEKEPSPEDAPESRENIKDHIAELRQMIARVAAAAAARRKMVDVLDRSAKIAKLDPLIHAQWLSQAGDDAAAIKIVEGELKKRNSEVRPLAILVDLLWRDGNTERANKLFERLRVVAADADIHTPLLARLKPIAEAAGIDGDWRIVGPVAEDVGVRPELDTLGPFRWKPSPVESWARNAPMEHWSRATSLMVARG